MKHVKADGSVPLNEIPKYLSPDSRRRLVDDALEEAWNKMAFSMLIERG